jgi:hypothetical protein
VPDFGSLQSCRLGLWGGRPGVGLGHHRRSSGDGNKGRVVVVVQALVGKCFCGYTSIEDDGLLDGLDRRRTRGCKCIRLSPARSRLSFLPARTRTKLNNNVANHAIY